MRTHIIHLINPRGSSFTNSPIYMNRALYSPLAGLLAVAAVIPQDKYEVILTDENIDPIDYQLKCDMVGISAMTSYVNRAYEIADSFRARGIPVVMGGVHPSFMPSEALKHADAVVVGEAETIMPQLLDDLRQGTLKHIYRAERLHPLVDLPLPRYELVKRERYLNSTFVQTSRGCHHGCSFCSEHLMNGLAFRFRPIDDVMREMESCGSQTISLNDADFFGSPERAAALMKALKGRKIRWQAGVDSRNAFDDRLLELAAESGCYLLSIGFESISRKALESVHKYQNHPENFRQIVDKLHSHGLLAFGLFIFGFDDDEESVFEETARFSVEAGLDVCAFSLLTPFPGTITWFEMLKQKRMRSFNWDYYDQGHIVFQTRRLSVEQISKGYQEAYQRFYALSSMLRRFPLRARRSKFHWLAYNLYFRKGVVQELANTTIAAAPTRMPEDQARPPIMPLRSDLRQLVLESGSIAG